MEPERLVGVSKSRSAATLIGVLAALLAPPLAAAEWTASSTLSSGVDDDSNRSLTPVPQQAQSTWLSSGFLFQGATETTQLSLAPQLHWQPLNRGRVPTGKYHAAAASHPCKAPANST